MITRTAILGAAALVLASAAFAAPDKKTKTTQVNACPESGKAVKDSKNTGVYGKYIVHFCCDKCKPGFDKLSKAEQQKKILAVVNKKKTAAVTTPASDS